MDQRGWSSRLVGADNDPWQFDRFIGFASTRTTGERAKARDTQKGAEKRLLVSVWRGTIRVTSRDRSRTDTAKCERETAPLVPCIVPCTIPCAQR